MFYACETRILRMVLVALLQSPTGNAFQPTFYLFNILSYQMKDILARRFLPEKYRLAVAKNVECHLFSKVLITLGVHSMRSQWVSGVC
jgi:hypothetical protein